MGRRRKNVYIFAPERQTHHLRSFLIGFLGVATLAIMILGTLNMVSNNQVEYLTQKVTVESLPSDLESFSILHLSDLHAADLGRDQSALRKVILQKNVSCVVMTGDMVGASGNVEPLLTVLDMLPKDLPVYLVAGDSDPAPLDPTAHDSISPYSAWLEAVVARGVIYLDEPVAITRNKSTLWLVPEFLYSLDLNSMETAYTAQLTSLQDPGLILTADQAAQKRVAEYQLGKIAAIRTSLAAMKEKDIQVAVSHTPLHEDYMVTMLQWSSKADVFSYHHVSLILAGHYVAGQWRMPGGGAIYVPEFGWFPEDQQLMGMDFLRGIPQYISPGLGASDYYFFPGRLFNQPAITYLQLTNKMT